MYFYLSLIQDLQISLGNVPKLYCTPYVVDNLFVKGPHVTAPCLAIDTLTRSLKQLPVNPPVFKLNTML